MPKNFIVCHFNMLMEFLTFYPGKNATSNKTTVQSEDPYFRISKKPAKQKTWKT